MHSRHAMRSPISGVLLTIALISPAFAEGSFDIPAGAHFNPQKLQRIGEFLRNEIADGKIPGAIVLIQQHGKPVYFELFGVRDVATGLPMTDDTIFRLYSMSKPITSVAAMMLIDEGKLKLDDPVAKYIPSFAEAKIGVEKDRQRRKVLELVPLNRPITILDLMRHTSGIIYGFYGDSLVRKLYDKADLCRRFRQCRVCRAHRAGCRWPSSRARCGIMAIPPTCWAESLRWCRENRFCNSKRSSCSIRSA